MTASGLMNSSARPTPISTISMRAPPSGCWTTCNCFPCAPAKVRRASRSSMRPSRGSARRRASSPPNWNARNRLPSRSRNRDPKGALLLLEQERKKIEEAGLAPQYRDALLRNCDRNVADIQQFIAKNGPRLELAERNNSIRQEIDRERQEKLNRQQKIATLVNEYNHLMDEQRWPEAEVVAKQAAELDPKNPVVEQLLRQSRFANAYRNSMRIKDEKEKGFNDAMTSVDETDIPFDDRNPIRFPDPKDWKKITGSRSRLARERQRRRNEQEMEIEKKLKTPVSVSFKAVPLNQVMDRLAKYADVNVHLDPQGLEQEGVSSDTPITIDLRHEIMLKSALNLILRAAALGLRGQGRGVEDHQRAGEGRPGLHGHLQRGRPGDPDPELRRRPEHGTGGGLPGRHGQRHRRHNSAGSMSTPMAVVASNRDSKQIGHDQSGRAGAVARRHRGQRTASSQNAGFWRPRRSWAAARRPISTA